MQTVVRVCENAIHVRVYRRDVLTRAIPENIPDLTQKLSPSRWGDATTFLFFSVGGLFLGGELGLLTGTASASRTVLKDPESRDRIEKALKNYRIDVLSREIQRLREAKMTTIL